MRAGATGQHAGAGAAKRSVLLSLTSLLSVWQAPVGSMVTSRHSLHITSGQWACRARAARGEERGTARRHRTSEDAPRVVVCRSRKPRCFETDNLVLSGLIELLTSVLTVLYCPTFSPTSLLHC